MKFILGKKIGMSQMFDKDRKVIPLTLVEAGPCSVIQIKTKEKDGYTAIQIGFGSKRDKNINKAQKGHLKKAETEKVRYLREFVVDKTDEYKMGQLIYVDSFKEGDKIRITGTTKGKGFQGVVKRHGFHGADASHGTKHNERAPGSIGSAWPERVLKGRRMAGRMGSDTKTLRGAQIVAIDKENNTMAIKGALPGIPGALLLIQG